MGTQVYPANSMQAETLALHRGGAGLAMTSTEEDMGRPWVTYDPESLLYDVSGNKHMFLFSLRNTSKTSPRSPRPGLELDESKFRRCFGNLGFTVHPTYHDFTRQQLYLALKRMCDMNHHYTSCVAVVFLTYGDKGGGTMDAADMSFLLDDVVNYVLHVPALAGKPKLFFNQACSRGNEDPGHRVFSCNRVAVTVPTHSDCYAVTSYEDEATLRSRQGSPFVEALCDVTDQHHREYDFVHLMALLNTRVNMETTHYTLNKPSTEDDKERPLVVYEPGSSDYDVRGDKHMFLFALRSTSKMGPQNPRPGMESDELKLRQCFENLGFTVHPTYHDFTLQQLYEALDKMCSGDHRFTSAVAIVFMTYGDKDGGKMYAADTSFHFDDVVNHVLHKSALAGKPKLFICQACSRGNKDSGHRVFSCNRMAVTVPTHSDCYAVTSYEDEATLRSRQGSPFVEALCDVTDQHHREYDFVHLMALLNTRVNMETTHYTLNKFVYL